MNRRTIVILSGLALFALFAGGALLYSRAVPEAAPPAAAAPSELIRAHSPVVGPAGAAVTIVEFLDPACESCRAFYPFVKQILATYPKEARLVVRYAAFHQGSDEAVRILEAARKQDRFEPVLEALFEKQQEWASHAAPDIARAWAIAGEAGVDVARARQDGFQADVDAVLAQDMADVRTLQIQGTPTFFVNGKQPASFGPEPLLQLVQSEVAAAK